MSVSDLDRAEDVLRQERLVAQLRGKTIRLLCLAGYSEYLTKRVEILFGRRFVKRHADRVFVDDANKVAGLFCFLGGKLCLSVGSDGQRVEELFMNKRVVAGLDARGKAGCKIRRPTGYSAQPVGTVPYRIGGRHVREQGLGGANVRRGLVPPDMLFAGLQRQPIGGIAIGIDGFADQAPRHDAGQAFRYADISGMRSAQPHWNPVSLHGADHDIGAPFAWRLHQGECQRVGNDNDKRTCIFCLFDEFGGVFEATERIGPGKDHGRSIITGCAVCHLDVERRHPGLQHRA